HLFAFGDINFEGNYYINPKGFASIGGSQERYFNEIRNLAFDCLHDVAHTIFGQSVLLRDNVQIIVEKEQQVPPPYTGSTKGNTRKRMVDEVTYENRLDLSYYETRKKLQSDMNYLYSHVPKEKYEAFWNKYQKKYNNLKLRYEEAYQIKL
ncbi:MAG: hypothetical protein HOJ29_02050, partial [Candidatus Magasanikbacteria bacterium]|nr:hypothetical protein [Candidatus Magasanikbacteria bacterium]